MFVLRKRSSLGNFPEQARLILRQRKEGGPLRVASQRPLIRTAECLGTVGNGRALGSSYCLFYPAAMTGLCGRSMCDEMRVVALSGYRSSSPTISTERLLRAILPAVATVLGGMCNAFSSNSGSHSENCVIGDTGFRACAIGGVDIPARIRAH